MLLAIWMSCSPVQGEEPGPVVEAAPPLLPEPPPVPPGPAIREPTDYDAPSSLSADQRVALAAKRGATVKALFTDAEVPYPPKTLLFRVYKAEAQLEVWGADGGPLKLVATWGICSFSGGPGPKRQVGDFQVPEGFYTIDYFKPNSDYHLAMRVGYPNASDKIKSKGKDPGGDIMIHGNCVSIGCLAMSDERIEELWEIARVVRERGQKVYVHILPARDLEGWITRGEYPEHNEFWKNLAMGEAIFRAEARLPVVTTAADGTYIFK